MSTAPTPPNVTPPLPPEVPVPGAGAAEVPVAQLVGSFKSGANWYYWIAGMSVVNSIVVLFFSGDWHFIVGLGITQVIDAIAMEITKDMTGGIAILKALAFGFDTAVALVFALFGFLANKRMGWAFVVGMVLYGLDGLLLLLVGDYFSFGFHVFALFCIGKGYSALRTINRTLATGN